MAEQICRLCLRTTLDNFPLLDHLRIVLDNFLSAPILNVSRQQNMVCGECRDNLQHFYDFKRACVDVRTGALPMADTNNISVDLEHFENKDITSVGRNPMPCDFCAKIVGKLCFISITELNKITSLVNIPEKVNPELNLNNGGKILSCESCANSLQGLRSFITNCYNVEEKIRKYIEVEGTDNNGDIDLRKVQETTFKPICDSAFKLGALAENPELFAIKSGLKSEHEEYLEAVIQHEEVDIKSEENENEEFKGDPDQQIPSYKDPSEKKIRKMRTYKCKDCACETLTKISLDQHMMTHKNPVKVHKCVMCTYTTSSRYLVKQHMMIHKGRSERVKYKCKDCPYEAITSTSIRKHRLAHKDLSTISVLKCDECPYKTIHKASMKKHTWTHINPTERKKYKCKECAYEAFTMTSIYRHMTTHKDPSEIVMYKCEECTYETKFKTSFKQHVSTYKHSFQRKTLKCEDCPFETMNGLSMRYHKVTHVHQPNIRMHKCGMCTFKASRRSQLEQHLLIHE